MIEDENNANQSQRLILKSSQSLKLIYDAIIKTTLFYFQSNNVIKEV